MHVSLSLWPHTPSLFGANPSRYAELPHQGFPGHVALIRREWWEVRAVLPMPLSTACRAS